MGVIISIFQFLWRAFRAILSFVISLPGLVFNAIVGVASFVGTLAHNIYGCLDGVITLIDTAQEYVDAGMNAINGQQYWGLFYNFFALDVFSRCFTGLVSLGITLAILVVFEFFFQGLVVAVPFLIYKSIGKILQSVSAGFAKAA